MLLALQLSSLAYGATPFLELLRKAETRSVSDPERVEFATRALREWVPGDGRMLKAQAYFLRAEGEVALFEDPAAEEDLTMALDVDVNNFRAKLMRSRARAALGKGADAERDALDYLAERADDAEGWLALGEARIVQGAPKADRPARAAYAKAANLLGVDDPRPSIGEGRSHLKMRRYQDALAALTAAAERPQRRRAEILSWRSRAYSALGDWSAARSDLTKALPDLERTLDDRNRANAAPRGVDAARLELADAYFRRGLANEALREREAALADHRRACELELPAACARVKALEKPEPKAVKPPKPKKAPRRKNPKGDSGERIYVN